MKRTRQQRDDLAWWKEAFPDWTLIDHNGRRDAEFMAGCVRTTIPGVAAMVVLSLREDLRSAEDDARNARRDVVERLLGRLEED